MKHWNITIVLAIISITAFGQIKEQPTIDSIFAEWSKPNVPGCAIGVFKEGQLVYAKGYGVANLEYDIPNTKTSVYRIASTSKQFTAACVIRLVQQDKLSLDDKLSKFFPSFPSYANKITVRHLLNHTSGIRDYLTLVYLKGLRDEDYYTDEELMDWLTNQTSLCFQPGEKHLYSNSGYWLLGQIVNKISGMDMAEFANQELFKPLGMAHTHFHDDHNKIVKNRATGYIPNDNGYEICTTTLDMIGDGGVFTTIEDMKKWDDAFYKSNVLNKEFWNMMTQRGVLNNGDTISYACGLMVDTYKGQKTISHGGAFVGYRAEILRFPVQQFTVVVLANRGDANVSRKAYKVANLFLKSVLEGEDEDEIVFKTSASNSTKYAMSQMVGLYELKPGLDMKVSIEDDSVQITQLWNNAAYKIVNVEGNTYMIQPDVNVGFSFSDLIQDSIQTLTLIQNGTETSCKRKVYADLAGVNVKDYAGSYYCKELDATYKLSIVNDTLQVTVKSNDPVALELNNKDRFTIYGNLIQFSRANNVVSGFTLDFGRVKNLRFEKVK